jgi:ribonuclease E
MAMHNALAPLWWDEADWDFSVRSEASEDEASLTDGEDDLQFLADGELEGESADDAFSWDGYSSPEEAAGSEDETSSGEYPPVKRFRAGSWDDDDDEDEDDDEEDAPVESSDGDAAGSSADEGEEGDGEDGGVDDEDSSSSSSDSDEEDDDEDSDAEDGP